MHFEISWDWSAFSNTWQLNWVPCCSIIPLHFFVSNRTSALLVLFASFTMKDWYSWGNCPAGASGEGGAVEHDALTWAHTSRRRQDFNSFTAPRSSRVSSQPSSWWIGIPSNFARRPWRAWTTPSAPIERGWIQVLSVTADYAKHLLISLKLVPSLVLLGLQTSLILSAEIVLGSSTVE